MAPSNNSATSARRVAEVGAKNEDEDDLADEHQAEKEGEAAHRVVAAPLEGAMVDLIDDPAHAIEDRREDDRREHRVELEARVEHEGAIGAEHHEGRMGDIGDVEKAERNRRARGHARVEAAEQQPRHDGVGKEIEREHVVPSGCSAFGRVRRGSR